MVKRAVVNPAPLGPPVGYAHGIRAGDLLFVAGQVGARPDPKGKLVVVSPDVAGQFDVALENVVTVVREAGGTPDDLVDVTIFVTDVEAYKAASKALGVSWRRHVGRHVPAMAVIGVSRLYEREFLIEIRATAVLEANR